MRHLQRCRGRRGGRRDLRGGAAPRAGCLSRAEDPRQINDPSQVSVTCLEPGIYRDEVTVQDPSSGLPNALLLLPGVYFFDAGLDVASTIIGGYEAGQPGVALVFLEAKNSSGIPGQFTTSSNDSLVALNFGNLYCPPGGPACPTGAAWADPADGPDGPVQTPAPTRRC